jgi:hypothetical protein
MAEARAFIDMIRRKASLSTFSSNALRLQTNTRSQEVPVLPAADKSILYTMYKDLVDECFILVTVVYHFLCAPTNN